MLGIINKIGSPFRLAILIALMGFVLRIALATWIGLSMPPEPGSDAVEYDTYAWNIVQGNGYRGMSPDVRDQNHLTAYRLPGPSLVWASLYSVFGHHYDVIRIANCFFGALAILLVFAIGRICYSDKVGLIAAAIYAIFPTNLFYSVSLLSEPLGNLSFLSFIWASLIFAERPTWRNAAISGLMFGLAIQFRANAILMMPFLVLWIIFQFRGQWRAILHACIIPALAIIMMIPWAVRNYMVFDKFIPLSTMGGSVLLQGNNDLVANVPELYGYNIWDTKIPQYKEALQSAGEEVERDRRAKNFAIAWIINHPEKWGYLIRMKIWRGLTPFLQPNSPLLYRMGSLFFWGPIFFLSVLAFIPTWIGFIRVKSGAWLIHLAILHFILISVIFFGYARYRQPIEPLCIIIAVRALLFLAQKFSSRKGTHLYQASKL